MIKCGLAFPVGPYRKKLRHHPKKGELEFKNLILNLY